MKLIVFSDSHGNLENVHTAMKFFKDKVIGIIHLGDFLEDGKKIQKAYPGIAMFYVSGNNDFSSEKTEMFFSSFNKKILLTHGHFYNVYLGTDKLFYRAKELGANICLFGHTHNPFIEEVENVFMLNPGSISQPRALDKPTFAILEIEKDKALGKIFTVDKNNIAEINIGGL